MKKYGNKKEGKSHEKKESKAMKLAEGYSGKSKRKEYTKTKKKY